MFEIKEEQGEYIEYESPKNQIKNKIKKKGFTVREIMKKNKINREKRLKRKFSKIEEIKKKKEELKRKEKENEIEQQRILRREMDQKIKERRKMKKKNEMEKKRIKKKRSENLKKAKEFYNESLLKKSFKGFSKIKLKNFEKIENVKEKLGILKKKQIFCYFKNILEMRNYEVNLQIKSFQFFCQNKIKLKEGFNKFKEACLISKKKNNAKASNFYKNLLLNKSLFIWKDRLNEMKTENFWIREKNKEKIKKFRKNRVFLIWKLGFDSLKTFCEKKKLEKEKEMKKKELRLKVDVWLKEFETKQLR
jgi:hypothetical protein